MSRPARFVRGFGNFYRAAVLDWRQPDKRQFVTVDALLSHTGPSLENVTEPINLQIVTADMFHPQQGERRNTYPVKQDSVQRPRHRDIRVPDWVIVVPGEVLNRFIA